MKLHSLHLLNKIPFSLIFSSNRNSREHFRAITTINHSRWMILYFLEFAAAAATPLAAAQTSRGQSPAAAQTSRGQYPVVDSYSNLNPALSILIVVIVFVFFFVCMFTFCIRDCPEDIAAARGFNSRYPSAARSKRGLDPKTIHSFPIFNYAEIKKLKSGKGALECAVCINEFEEDETLRLLPKCNHVFHPECIDAWLASHSTCPVCRANLIPTSGEISGNNARDNSDSNSRSEHSEVTNQNQVSINVDVDDEIGDPQASESQEENRKSLGKFLRSHSTGHSLVQPGENCERYTLRLPEEVRRQIMTHVLKRTTSCVFVLPTEGSDWWRQGERSNRVGCSDRWVLTMTPPFVSTIGSVLSPKVGCDGDATSVGKSVFFMTSVKTPFDDCVANGPKGEQTSNRLPV